MSSARVLFTTLFVAMCFAISVQAAEEIQGDVPLELVKALLGNNNPFDIRLYSGVPDNFPEIVIPDSVELLGSADMGHSQQVVMRAEGDGVNQRSQIMTALENLGYLMLTQPPGSNLEQTGFVTPRFIPPNMPVQFCHDVRGMMTVHITGTMVRSTGPMLGGPVWTPQSVPFTPFSSQSQAISPATGQANTSYNSVINMTASGGTNGPRMASANCAQMLAQYSGRMQSRPARMNLNQYMPRMELPADAALPSSPGMSPAFTSGLPKGMESSIDMAIDWDLDRVFR
ncbi:MAG: hypothetical protein WD600_00680, partial [Pseudohongiella sp.]